MQPSPQNSRAHHTKTKIFNSRFDDMASAGNGKRRVQTVTQLYIIDDIPIEKMRPWPSALDELKRME